MVVSDFSSKLVFLDTAPLIYFIGGSSQYQDVLAKLFLLNDKGVFSFITSSITLLEVLVKPLKEGRKDFAMKYKDILTKATGIELLDVGVVVSETAATLRAEYNLRTPDAIQLASAIERKADYFLTNDIKLKIIPSVRVVLLDDLL